MRLIMKLKAWRKQQRITQQQLADILGCTKITVSNWERGARIPKAKFLMKLIKLSKEKVTANDFF